MFTEDGDGNRNKRMEKYFEVSVVVDVGVWGYKSFVINRFNIIENLGNGI